MYQALYRKYRPHNLNDVCGQPVVTRIIKNALKNSQINHAYIFAGPRGTGKTSVAKIYAKLVNCENPKDGVPCGKCQSCLVENNPDIIEIDAASNNGVDEIRELKDKISLVPTYGKYKIYIIDEVHMLSTGAFNALLKTLEEPPAHVIFILATTDPQKIPETIISRCQRLDFKRITNDAIFSRLKEISKKENIKITDDAIKEIAILSDGGMRDSIGMLDEARSYTDSEITLDDIHELNGIVSKEEIKELIKVINQSNYEEIFKKIDQYNSYGANFIKLTSEIIDFLRNILILKEAPNYFKENNTNIKIYEDIKDDLTINKILGYIQILSKSLPELRAVTNPKLLFEVNIIKLVEKNQLRPQVIETPKREETIKKVETPKAVEKVQNTPIPKKEETKTIKHLTPNEEIRVDHEKLKELVDIRINNALANFQKRELIKLRGILPNLKDYILDPEYSKSASIILDGTLKAASDKYLIFDYKEERISRQFNENIPAIENTLKNTLKLDYSVVSVNDAVWQTIKDEFNSRKKTYTLKEDNIKLTDVFKKEKNTEFADFEDIIEYE